MKLLTVIPGIGASYGGPSKSVTELVEALAHQGIEVDMVTTNADTNRQLEVTLQTWIPQGSYRIQYFPYWHVHDYKISPSLTRWLIKNVANYDIVMTHANFSYISSVANWICRSQKVPYVMNPHGMLEPWALSYKAWKKRFYYTWFEQPALQNASAIRVLASREIDNVKQLHIDTPLMLAPNGIHCEDFETLPNPQIFLQAFPKTQQKSLILFMGRIDPKKGLDLLAKAFAQVHAVFPQTHLVVAGPDNTRFLSTVQGYFKEAGCLDSVTFTGILTGELKFAAFAAADVYIAPSYSEGFSMSVLEGMASSLPCVITTACNFPEATAANAAIVVEIDSEAIANALLRCLNHPDEAKAMGDRARQFILENYTWDKIAVQMKQVYIDILKNH